MVGPKGVHDEKKDVVHPGYLASDGFSSLPVPPRPEHTFFSHDEKAELRLKKGHNGFVAEIGKAFDGGVGGKGGGKTRQASEKPKGDKGFLGAFERQKSFPERPVP